MLPDHVLLKLQTGRDAQQTPEAIAQVFATLPAIRNARWHRLLGYEEAISFEIAVCDQLITFYAHVPDRFADYLRGAITAAYTEALVTKATDDPFDSLLERPGEGVLLAANIGLRAAAEFPIRTYRDSPETDPLAAALSALSRVEPDDLVVLQCLVGQHCSSWGYSWRKDLLGQLLGAQPVEPHPQRSLSDRKLRTVCVRSWLRVAILTSTKKQGQLWLAGLSSALRGFALHDSNELTVRPFRFSSPRLLRAMAARRPAVTPMATLSVDELATLYHLPNQPLATIPNISWGKQLAGEPPETLPLVKQPGQHRDDPEIVPLGRTRFKNRDVLYGIKRADRRRHVYIVGKTGTGKSTLMANMAIHDIQQGEGLCIIDPHGDLVETLLDYVPSHRVNDVIYFNPSNPERVVKINPFEGSGAVHRELIASGIVAVFHKLYAEFWGPRLEYILRNSLLSLLHCPAPRLSDILDLLTNQRFRTNLVMRLNDPVLKRFWVDEFEAMPDRLRAEAIAPILNKVGQFVSSPLVREVVNTPKSSFKIAQAMNEGKVLLVSLSQGKLGEDNATLLGAMLITQIQLAAMSRVRTPEEERRDFFLYVDEFQNFATESFIKILSEARKYRLNLTLANQYTAQIPERTQKAILGNSGTLISFVLGADDTARLRAEFHNQFSVEDLVGLDPFRMVARVAIDNVTCRPFTGHTQPLVSKTHNSKTKVIRVSNERYARNRIRDVA